VETIEMVHAQEQSMKQQAVASHTQPILAMLAIAVLAAPGLAQEPPARGATSYAPVAGTESFRSIVDRMSAAKPAIVARHTALLEQRYDLADRPNRSVHMSGGKAVQSGVRVKLPSGVGWDGLAAATPA